MCAVSQHLKHMDTGSRNARLCATLQDMGLFVLPVFAADDPERIDYMMVSVGLPADIVQQPPEDAARAAVAPPVTGADVDRTIRAAEDRCVNVVDFPSVLRKVTIVTKPDQAPVAVHSDIQLPGNHSGL